MRIIDFTKWFGRIIIDIFPYGLILALTVLSIGFFVYEPFSLTSLSLSSALVIVTLVFGAYLHFSHSHPRVKSDC